MIRMSQVCNTDLAIGLLSFSEKCSLWFLEASDKNADFRPKIIEVANWHSPCTKNFIAFVSQSLKDIGYSIGMIFC